MKRRILESESSLQRLPRKALGFAAAASVGIAVLFGCGSPDDGTADQAPHSTAARHGKGSSATGATAGGDVGSVGFNLQLGAASVDQGNYNIHGNGFDSSGPIDLSQATNVSVIVGGVPLGTGYTATMAAHSTSGLGLSCTGQATFDVTTTEMTSVPVPMECKETAVVPVPRVAVGMLGLLFAASGMMLLRGGGRARLRRA